MTDSEFVDKYMAALEKQQAEEAEEKGPHRMSFNDVQVAIITTPPVTM